MQNTSTYMMLEIQLLVWDMHKHVMGLNRLMGSQPSTSNSWVSNNNTDIYNRRIDISIFSNEIVYFVNVNNFPVGHVLFSINYDRWNERIIPHDKTNKYNLYKQNYTLCQFHFYNSVLTGMIFIKLNINIE